MNPTSYSTTTGPRSSPRATNTESLLQLRFEQRPSLIITVVYIVLKTTVSREGLLCLLTVGRECGALSLFDRLIVITGSAYYDASTRSAVTIVNQHSDSDHASSHFSNVIFLLLPMSTCWMCAKIAAPEVNDAYVYLN